MWLAISTGDQAGSRVEVTGEQFLVGRGDGCDLVLRDWNVSRRHAYMRALDDGTLELRDLGSSNGTFVNGHRVEEATLRGGEQIQFGDTVLHVEGGDDSPDQATHLGGGAPAPMAGPAPAAARPTESAIVRAIRGNSGIQRLVIEPALRRSRLTAAAALVVAVALIALLVTGVIGGEGDRADDAVKAAIPSTVLVVPERDGEATGANGSGWVLDAGAGLVVTNAHVVNAGTSFRVGFGGKFHPARVVAVAPCDDLAILRVRGATGMRTMPLGSQRDLALGETVVAVGFPESATAGANLTSTSGVVSVVRQPYRDAAALDVPEYPNVVQTDAAVNPGNSGGPLLDLDGRLVGVNSAQRTTTESGRVVQGQSFAIGVDRVKQVVPALRAGRSAGWTGATFTYPAADRLAARGLPEGIFIESAVEGTPAARAGLGAETSLLVAVNGKPVANTLASYCAAVNGLKSGAAATFTMIPPGKREPEDVKVRLA